jgi:hypothetical protein
MPFANFRPHATGFADNVSGPLGLGRGETRDRPRAPSFLFGTGHVLAAGVDSEFAEEAAYAAADGNI